MSIYSSSAIRTNFTKFALLLPLVEQMASLYLLTFFYIFVFIFFFIFEFYYLLASSLALGGWLLFSFSAFLIFSSLPLTLISLVTPSLYCFIFPVYLSNHQILSIGHQDQMAQFDASVLPCLFFPFFSLRFQCCFLFTVSILVLRCTIVSPFPFSLSFSLFFFLVNKRG